VVSAQNTNYLHFSLLVHLGWPDFDEQFRVADIARAVERLHLVFEAQRLQCRKLSFKGSDVVGSV
jgi:hypothetical protein